MGFLKRLFGSAEPDRQREPPSKADLDAVVIQQLTKAGADLTQRRETLHYLYVPNEDDAGIAERNLSRGGRKIEVRPAATGGSWLVLITESMIVNPATIAGIRAELEDEALKFGGNYDGWEAALTPD
ncbi:MAG: ribonuclease E inhibitor RraB [Chloroflexota bacterium]